MPNDASLMILDILECKVCLKEIPVSEAKMAEADEYVYHFCGLECYAKWRAQEEPEAS